VPERVLAVLRELERADEQIGAALASLDRLAGEVDSVRAKVSELEAFAAQLPATREAQAAELERSRAEASTAQRVLEDAQAALHAAGPDGAPEAERFHVRARDRASVAQRRVAEAAAAAADLENRVAETAIDGHELHARARKLAAELHGRHRIAEDAGKEPGPSLDGVEAWSEVARASLFVARGQLSAEREAVIRQANELGALALGEPMSAMGTGALTRRVEQALG
jgi:chromosome segregation ATPase